MLTRNRNSDANRTEIKRLFVDTKWPLAVLSGMKRAPASAGEIRQPFRPKSAAYLSVRISGA